MSYIRFQCFPINGLVRIQDDCFISNEGFSSIKRLLVEWNLWIMKDSRRSFSNQVLVCSSLIFLWLNQKNRQSVRSEEHTSELQSLMRISYAVFCLTK